MSLGCPTPFTKDTFSHQVNPVPGFIYYNLLAPILLSKIFPPFFFCAFLSHQFHTFLGYVPSRCRWCLCHFEAFQVIPLSSFLLSISSYPICKDGGPLLLLRSICCSKSVFQSCSGFWHLLKSHSSFLPKTLLFSPLLDPSYSDLVTHKIFPSFLKPCLAALILRHISFSLPYLSILAFKYLIFNYLPVVLSTATHLLKKSLFYHSLIIFSSIILFFPLLPFW